MTRLHEALEAGQSIWLDNIQRSMLTSGELKRLIEQGLRGMTSNPTIFEKAIGGSDDYDEDIQQHAAAGKSDKEIYEALAIADVQMACDIFRPVYDNEEIAVDGLTAGYGNDGYVSLEADPHLADDTAGTIEEIRRLHALVGRPNAMFKVPATEAGIPAIRQLTADGININITLIFSVKHYDAVADAFMAGLEQRLQHNEEIMGLASVASFFVSRIDSKLDPRLAEMGQDTLKGTVGLSVAKSVYQRFSQVFTDARWKRLAPQGARVQRVLYGSTSTKNENYSDTVYVDNLIGPHTVNTMPMPTLAAFLDHGVASRTVDQNYSAARVALEKLANAGLNLTQVGDELQREGVQKFADSFDNLLATIADKREKVSA
jgi:transaldolase/transaldolase/glucose-6-phosphate isomerase